MSQPCRDEGVTLIEVLVTVALLSAMMVIALSGWSSWARASEQTGAARELQSLMRRTQQSAVTEGRAMCVQFDVAADQYSVFRGACSDAARTRIFGPVTLEAAQVSLSAPAFTGSTAGAGATFYARGTATPGTVSVTREGSTRVWTITVERLTGRVALS